MPRTFQNQLLNFMESGRVKVDQMKRQYDFEIKVFATCNDINRLSRPLQSRFKTLFLPKLSPGIARYIGNAIWNNQGDIRDVISVGKLVRKSDGPEQINLIVRTLTKYGQRGTREKSL